MKSYLLILMLFGGALGAWITGRTQITPSDLFSTAFILGLAVIMAIYERTKGSQ